MVPFCVNKSPRRLCEEVEKVLPADSGRMVRRPFDHYRPTMTDWWIVPSLELPFFKFGKYGFRWNPETRDSIACGLWVTKGLAPALKKVYPSRQGRRLIMDDSWGWHRLFPALRDGRLATLVRERTAACGMTAELVFDGGYIDDPGLFDPQTDRRTRDCYTLLYDPAAETLRVGGARRDAMCLKFLNKVRDWTTFAAAAETLNGEDFLWCDLWIALRFRVCEYGEPEAGAAVRDAAWIYREWLAAFREFVR